MVKNLLKAKKERNDEFYTQLQDIEKELLHYKEFFKEKIVYCNCDNPTWSNFFKFFVKYGKEFGIKEAWFTNYAKNKERQLTMFDNMSSNEDENVAHYWRYIPRLNKTIKKQLKGNGDFRSEESIELLKQSDVVVTNPPFSLFREYVSQLIEFNKKFIIIGNTNALTYREIFKLFKEDKIRTGYTKFNVGMYFIVPNSCEHYHKIEDGKKMVRVSTSCWFTNLPVKKHNQFLPLYKPYNVKEYPKYDNYDAINVDTYTDIPDKYYGEIGVPITFLDKYNPDQFEIIGQGQGNLYRELNSVGLSQKFVDDYYKFGGKGSIKEDHPVLGYYDNNGKPIIPYMRIVIRRKKHAN